MSILLSVVVALSAAPDSPTVTLLKTPDGGIQPQAAIDGEGVIHLLYYKGDPAAGDLFYTRRAPKQSDFTAPVRVNSQPGSAIAIGTIRGGQLALGKGGRIHVVWNGSGRALPKNPLGGSPMLYSRSTSDGTGFEPQRNLMTRSSLLDGGGTVAADGAGNVYVAWHARSEGAVEGEMGRRMWVARSTDDGATFAPEEPAFERETGACACCGTRALADRAGNVYALYRAATGGVDRDLYLLAKAPDAPRWTGRSLQPWRTSTCPMSSASLSEAPKGILAAWETEGQVAFAQINPRTQAVSKPISPPGRAGTRKHPAVAGNTRGETILVWTEGTGWQKGGNLVWQVFDRDGKPTGEAGKLRGGIPVWGLPTVVAGPFGGFTIFH